MPVAERIMKHKDKNHSAGEPAPHASAPVAEAGAPAAVPPPPPAAAVPPMPDPLEALQAEAADFRDKWLRTRADLENYRKRVQREFQEIRTQERLLVVKPFLGVFDQFQMALEHFATAADAAAMKDGMAMILDGFRKCLADLQIEVIDATGKPFDPHVHEAISQESSDSVPAGHVLRQWKTGYKAGDLVLRPASVIVSGGPATSPAPAE